MDSSYYRRPWYGLVVYVFYVLVLHTILKRLLYPSLLPHGCSRVAFYILLLRVAVCVCVCVSSHHDLPPLKAATTDAALGGRVGSASLLNMFLTGGTQMGNAAPTKPKAHDHTTIGSLCKNVVQNPAMSFSSGEGVCVCVCFFSFRSSALSEEDKRGREEERGARERFEDFRSE